MLESVIKFKLTIDGYFFLINFIVKSFEALKQLKKYLGRERKGKGIWVFRNVPKQCHIAGVAKVRPVGRMRPSKDFLRPPCQILVASLSYLWQIYVRKRPIIDTNYVKKKLKTRQINILRPTRQYLNEIWPVDKKVWLPLSYSID